MLTIRKKLYVEAKDLSPFVKVIIGSYLNPPATSCEVKFATSHNFTVFLFQEKKITSVWEVANFSTSL